MTPSTRGNLTFTAAIIAVVAMCIVFPRIGTFAELAARELRFMWWILLIAGVIFLIARGGKDRS